MSNTNCLEGFACPSCRSEGPFRIEAKCLVSVRDDGIDADETDFEWDDDSFCGCMACSHAATVAGFTGKSEPKPEAFQPGDTVKFIARLADVYDPDSTLYVPCMSRLVGKYFKVLEMTEAGNVYAEDPASSVGWYLKPEHCRKAAAAPPPPEMAELFKPVAAFGGLSFDEPDGPHENYEVKDAYGTTATVYGGKGEDPDPDAFCKWLCATYTWFKNNINGKQ